MKTRGITLGDETGKEAKPKRPVGRPSGYRPEFCDCILEFFFREPTRTLKKTITTKNGTVIEEQIEVPNDLPTFAEFAMTLGVVRNTLKAWAREHPEFLTAYNRAYEMAEDFLVKLGLKGLYNPKAFIFVAQNYTGMRDKQQLLGSEDKPLIPDEKKEVRRTYVIEKIKREIIELRRQEALGLVEIKDGKVVPVLPGGKKLMGV